MGRKGAYKDQNHPSVPPATPGVASKPSSSKPSSHDSNKSILQVKKSANPDQTNWDSFEYFVHLTQAVAKRLSLQIAKTHQVILLNYAIFQLEARLTSLTASYSQMILGMTSKDEVLGNAKKTHQIRERAIGIY